MPLKLVWVFVSAILALSLAPGDAQHREGMTAQDYGSWWARIDSLEQQGLPRSALEETEALFEHALEEAAEPHIVRATIYRAKYVLMLEEDAAMVAIDRVRQDLDRMPVASTALSHSVLARLYWNYYQSNRYRFLERSATAVNDDDMLTWDARKLVETVVKHHETALSYDEKLKQESTANFAEILLDADKQEAHPTLFDVVANEAIQFFENEEAGIVQPKDAFVVDFKLHGVPIDEFISADLATDDTLSFDYRALSLYRRVLDFHRRDSEPAPRLLADLERLRFVYRRSPEDREAFLASLRGLEATYENTPAVAEVSYYLASDLSAAAEQWVEGQPDSVRWGNREAIAHCKRAADRYMKSLGAGNCLALIGQIQRKELGVSVEEVNEPDADFRALITYRNLPRVYLRIVEVGADSLFDYMTSKGYLDERAVSRLKGKRTVWNSSVDLPLPGDYLSHSVEVALPAMRSGAYALLVGSDQSLRGGSEAVHASLFQVSRLGYLNRARPGGGMDLRVYDRWEGRTLEGVNVIAKTDRPVRGGRRFETLRTSRTDQTGYTLVPFTPRTRVYIELENDGDRLIAYQPEYVPDANQAIERDRSVTYFFTDRRLYRPGQTVFFKGLLLTGRSNNYEVRKQATTTVRFMDANGQEVDNAALVSNEYGAVSGSFVAPRGVLTGEMRLVNENGAATIAVEEYRRPKFEVTIEDVAEDYSIGDPVVVRGHARFLSGPAVEGEASYRVVRRQYFWPYHYGFFRMPPPSADQVMAVGRTSVGPTGAFEVSFVAQPDARNRPGPYSAFNYEVAVDVTDIGGETQSATTTVTAGGRSLVLDLSIDQRVNKDSLRSVVIVTNNLNNVAVAAEGQVRIYRLKAHDRLLRNRLWNTPDQHIIDSLEFVRRFPHDPYADEENISTWATDREVFVSAFNTGHSKSIDLSVAGDWKPGAYKVVLTANDSKGRNVEAVRHFVLYDAGSDELPYGEPTWFEWLKQTAEPGEVASFLIGASGPGPRALIETEFKGRIVADRWITLSGMERVDIPVKEEFRGGVTAHITYPYLGRVFTHSASVIVPFTNKRLNVELVTFRDQLLPGQDERWTLKVSDSEGQPVQSEILAAMYDASLDQIIPHTWTLDLYQQNSNRRAWRGHRSWGLAPGWFHGDGWNQWPSITTRRSPRLNWFGLQFYGRYFSDIYLSKSMRGTPDAMMVTEMAAAPRDAGFSDDEVTLDQSAATLGAEAEPQPRKNLAETAFFEPHLATTSAGTADVSFTVPEALTRWKLLVLAHTTDVRLGRREASIVTAKQLMVTPNLPRFVREGDTLVVTARIANVTEDAIAGEASLRVNAVGTGQTLLPDVEIPAQSFTTEANGGASVSWELIVPRTLGLIEFTMTAAGGGHSDGEVNVLPVLPSRMLVTESLPLPMSGPGTKAFRLEKLASNASSTLDHHALTLEYSPNPAWYAVKALPYLAEFPYECSEQIFSRIYANTLAAHIVDTNPRIASVYAEWKDDADALQSELQKNEDLKSVVLEETPWVRQAMTEAESRRQIARLFDLPRIREDLAAAVAQLEAMQLPSGAWPWFPGLRENRFITQHIVAGFGRMNKIGATAVLENMQVMDAMPSALSYLDGELRRDYDRLLARKAKMDENHLSPIQIHHLYTRSFFPGVPIEQENRQAYEYYAGQARKYWSSQGIYMKGLMALSLGRMGDDSIAGRIMESLTEFALESEELGMYWRDLRGFYWYEAPIERQAVMIEAYHEVVGDEVAVAKLQLWLLKQKQTQSWETTKATSDAVYALLMRGQSLLAVDSRVRIAVGAEQIDSRDFSSAGTAEAGSGYFRTSWSGEDVSRAMADVSVTKEGEGPAWGAVYWQYFEDLDRITSAESPLAVRKDLFVERRTDDGNVLVPLTDTDRAVVGDLVKVRLVIQTDRDLEYVHIKDMRGAGLEPVAALSGPRYQDGLSYYESPRDATMNFFASYMPRGTYVFEYPLRVRLAGQFSNGIASVQCMYAPEFSAHSEGRRLTLHSNDRL